MKKLIVVNKRDKVLGYKSKVKCHQRKGILHRAFSILVFNLKGELLIQKRSRFKQLWPLFWSNTCCSHPLKDEEIKKSAEKRLKEELGFSCPLEFLFKFLYRASFKDKGSECELVYVFKGVYNGKAIPDKKEIADWRWVSLTELKEEIKKKPEIFTPWFKKILKDEAPRANARGIFSSFSGAKSPSSVAELLRRTGTEAEDRHSSTVSRP